MGLEINIEATINERDTGHDEVWTGSGEVNGNAFVYYATPHKIFINGSDYPWPAETGIVPGAVLLCAMREFAEDVLNV